MRPEREACLQLGADLELAWNHEGVSAETRKRILRAALEEIVVWCEEWRTRLLLHWRGGDHTELFVARRARGQHRHVTDVETGALITGLARQIAGHGDRGVAEPVGPAQPARATAGRRQTSAASATSAASLPTVKASDRSVAN